MDADAMIYNFTVDLTNFWNTDGGGNDDINFLLAAHRVSSKDNIETYNINNGITLWNLHHPLVEKVVTEWYSTSHYGLTLKDGKGGDQMYLQRILKKYIDLNTKKEEMMTNKKKKSDNEYIVYSLQHEFEYRQGTVVKHFIRENIDFSNKQMDATAIWTGTYGSNLDVRSKHIQDVAKEICTTYRYSTTTTTTSTKSIESGSGTRNSSVCDGIEHVRYTQMGI